MSGQKNGGYWSMSTPEYFELALKAYQGTTTTRQADLASSDYFFLYWDTEKLFADCSDDINCLDRSKIYLSCQPDPALITNSGGGGASQSDIDRLADVMTQNYKDAHNQKDEVLILYNSTTKVGVPKQCIERHSKQKKIDYVISKSEMTEFKNELTPDTNGNQQEQTFVTSHIGGSQYLIYYDSALYQYLLYQSKKD